MESRLTVGLLLQAETPSSVPMVRWVKKCGSLLFRIADFNQKLLIFQRLIVFNMIYLKVSRTKNNR